MELQEEINTVVAVIMLTIVILSAGFGGYYVINDDNLEQKEEYTNDKCFQRIIRYDRFIDYKENIVTNGYFYNTTWEETNCGDFEQDKYETLDVLVALGEGEKNG